MPSRQRLHFCRSKVNILMVRVNRLVAQHPGDGGKDTENDVLHLHRRTQRLKDILELLGDQSHLQQIGHALAVSLPFAGQTEHRPDYELLMRVPGSISTMTLASSSPAFHQSCGIPRGRSAEAPGSRIRLFPPNIYPIFPFRTVNRSSASRWMCGPSTAPPGRTRRSETISSPFDLRFQSGHTRIPL